MLKYRTGELFSNLELSSSRATILDSTVEVWLEMANLGNVSYMGVLNLSLKDNDGKVMSDYRTNVAVYRTQKRRLELAMPDGEFKPPY